MSMILPDFNEAVSPDKFSKLEKKEEHSSAPSIEQSNQIQSRVKIVVRDTFSNLAQGSSAKLQKGEGVTLQGSKKNYKEGTATKPQMVVMLDSLKPTPQKFGAKHQDPSTKFEQFFKEMTDLNTLDLNHPVALSLIKDILTYSDKSMQSELIKWLLQQPTFNAQTCQACFEGFSEPSDTYKDLASIKKLMDQYIDRSLNKDLPSNTPSVINTIKYLLQEEQIQDTDLTKFTAFLTNQKDFSQETFNTFIKIVEDKSKRSSFDHPSGVKDQLLEAFNRNDWGQKIGDKLPPSTIVYLADLNKNFDPNKDRVGGVKANIPEDVVQKARDALPKAQPASRSSSPLDIRSRSDSSSEPSSPQSVSSVSSLASTPSSSPPTSREASPIRPASPPVDFSSLPSNPRIDKYLSNDKPGTIELKQVFDDVSSVTGHPRANVEPKKLSSVEHLIVYVTGEYKKTSGDGKQSKQIDLSHPNSLKILRDVFRNKPGMTKDLVDWLTNPVPPKNISSKTIEACLQSYTEQVASTGQLPAEAQFLTIAKLIDFNSKLPEEQRLLPTHPINVAATKILLGKSLTNQFVNENLNRFVELIIRDQAFTKEIFAELITVCMQRGAVEVGLQPLINAFNAREDLRNAPFDARMLTFLKANGAKI